jgi:hypothetical protein
VVNAALNSALWQKYPSHSIDEFIVGCDLGKSIDSTAIAILHHTLSGTGEWLANEPAQFWREKAIRRLDVRHVERFPLGVNYVIQAHRIREILTREPLKNGRTWLVVDQSGVGAGVVDLMEASGLRPIRLQITAGAEQSREGRTWRVAKQILISKLEAAMHSKELQIAAGLAESGALRDELRDFQRHTTATGANTWSARAGKHDDIVLAVSYAVWWSSNRNEVFQGPLGC